MAINVSVQYITVGFSSILYCFDPMRLKLGNPFKTMKIFCSNTKRFDNFSPPTRWMLRIMKV